MSDYPEHDKLALVKDETQAAGEFIEWLGNQGVFLAKRYMFDKNDQCTENDAEERYTRCLPVSKNLVSLLAEWAGIDQNKIEAEKRQMLASLRAANA